MDENQSLEEPDVTPLINVNLVILVMVLAIAAHSARLLPLGLPKGQQTTFVEMSEAAQLSLLKDGTYRLKVHKDTGDFHIAVEEDGTPYYARAKAPLTADDLAVAIQSLDADSILLVSMDLEAKYTGLVKALDYIMERPDLKVAFGQAGAATPAPTSGPALTPTSAASN